MLYISIITRVRTNVITIPNSERILINFNSTRKAFELNFPVYENWFVHEKGGSVLRTITILVLYGVVQLSEIV